MIYADQRWMGEHGIGHFARHVLSGVPYRPLQLATRPAAVLDPYRLMIELRKLSAGDLFFSPGYNAPVHCRAPFIFTVHDLNHLDRPENSSALKRLYYDTVIRSGCRRAARILTVSEFSRGRIAEWSGVDQGKIINVFSGVGKQYHPGVEPARIDGEYVLCVSNRKAHKNDMRLVEAFALAALGDVKLLFTGHPTPALAARISQLGLGGRVLFAGEVPGSELPGLYRGAVATAVVSLYEGFSLPLVESMACGTPVVASNCTALPETAGGAALLVDPFSVEEIAAGLRRVVGEPSLREVLRARGLARAAEFPWERTAELVRAVLDDVSECCGN
jgi:glycosyltransferase involved in cell wall biosynthesis